VIDPPRERDGRTVGPHLADQLGLGRRRNRRVKVAPASIERAHRTRSSADQNRPFRRRLGRGTTPQPQPEIARNECRIGHYLISGVHDHWVASEETTRRGSTPGVRRPGCASPGSVRPQTAGEESRRSELPYRSSKSRISRVGKLSIQEKSSAPGWVGTGPFALNSTGMTGSRSSVT